ncbi:MAG: DUF2341 domain-containing protein [Verrucomicrobiia bacterium]
MKIPKRWRLPAGIGALLMIGLMAHALGSSRGWWNGGWTIRKKITINLDGAEIKDPVGTTAVLLRLSEGAFQFAAAREDGSDLRFVAPDDKTLLKYHIEKFDPMLGEAFVWVKVPDLKPGAPTSFWLYSGNAGGKLEKPEEPKETYDADTVLVYHFAERGQPPADSSGTDNHAQNAGPITDGAVIGPGLRLDGKTTITVPASASLEWAEGAPMTWSVWVKPSAPQPGAVIFCRRDGEQSFLVGVHNGAPFVEVGRLRTPAGNILTPNAWHHLAVVAERSKMTLYLDGEAAGTLDAGLPALKGSLVIGGDSSGGGGFAGEIDELMISKVARPAGALKLAAFAQGGEKAMKVLALGQDEQKKAMIDTGYFGVILKSVTVDGWVVIVILILMGIGSWYVMIEKVKYLQVACRGNEEFLKEWRHVAADLSVLDHGDPDTVKSMGGRVKGGGDAAILQAPIYRIYHVGADEIRLRRSKTAGGRPRALSALAVQSIRASLDAGVVREAQKLNNLIVLLTISIAGGPFLGLLGTVVGVMITFAAIAAAGEVNVNSIAPGIAAALVATVAGLAVAIPALFGYNYIVSRIKEVTTDMQVFVDEFVTRMAEFYGGSSE